MTTGDDVDRLAMQTAKDSARAAKHLESIDRKVGKIYGLLLGAIVLVPMAVLMFLVWRANG